MRMKVVCGGVVLLDSTDKNSVVKLSSSGASFPPTVSWDKIRIESLDCIDHLDRAHDDMIASRSSKATLVLPCMPTKILRLLCRT